MRIHLNEPEAELVAEALRTMLVMLNHSNTNSNDNLSKLANGMTIHIAKKILSKLGEQNDA